MSTIMRRVSGVSDQDDSLDRISQETAGPLLLGMRLVRKCCWTVYLVVNSEADRTVKM